MFVEGQVHRVSSRQCKNGSTEYGVTVLDRTVDMVKVKVYARNGDGEEMESALVPGQIVRLEIRSIGAWREGDYRCVDLVGSLVPPKAD